MDFLRRRLRVEFVILTVAVAVSVISVVLWLTVLNNSDTPEDPSDQQAIRDATATATIDEGAAASPPSSSTPLPASEPDQAPSMTTAGDTCQVVAPEADLPPGIPSGDPSHGEWYGSQAAGIWMSPINRGAMIPEGAPESSSLWFAGEPTYLMSFGTSSPIHLTGEQLDGSATLGVVRPASVPTGQIQWSIFTIPDPGCWQISAATARDEDLTLIVEVLPMAHRPDIIYAENHYATRPYEEPSSCPVTPWTGPESRNNHDVAQYWLDADGMSVGLPGWFTAGQEQILDVHGSELAGGLSATATGLDENSGEAVEATTTAQSSGGYTASLTFPEAGCWELDLSTGSTAETFVVYVYPEQ